MFNEVIVLVIIIVAVVMWAIVLGYRSLYREEPLEQLYLSEHFVHDDEVESLLEKHGYEIVGGKFYVPFTFLIDETEEVPSRLWVDLVAQQEERWYVVRIARERMQLDWNAAGIRKQWLPYFHAFPDADGVIVVNVAERSVRLIRMEVGEPTTSSE
ncbi:DNA-binding protein [Paenibacillus sp. 1001270B_150601_E10]|uniref:DNA-binding protein n=1 Tax=Paenibacillus sp. 1001270B_150601_E10 TaxID=2787079 RepID=UPI00189CA492|nr:DNA-binding protein [Paenibacillus sp. 1001270B_150601_E10]